MPIYLQHGNLIDYVPPTDTSTEDVVFMGGLVGIPQTFIPAGELGALSVDGVYMFTKKDGVSVNLGDVVKYCGTTKLAQDSNADLPLGVAVADADADDLYTKVKINSVLPTSGGGGGGEVTIDTSRGLSDNGCGIGIYIGTGLSFGSCGELNATGGGGSGSIELTDNHSLYITGEEDPTDYGDVVNIGYCNGSSSTRSVILGAYANNCSASDAVVIGYCSYVWLNAQGGIAIGSGAKVAEDGCGSIAIGLEAKSCSPNLSRGNIVIGNGINPYSDSALLIVGGNGATGDYREGILLYSSCSNFLDGTCSQGAGIAYLTSTNRGENWTLFNNIKFSCFSC